MNNRAITLFFTDSVERETLAPIVPAAKALGYSVVYSDNIRQPADIGIYCQHKCYPQNSKFSVIMLHDFAQGHNRWPNIWENEPWNQFDIGILPGPIWSKRWQECSWHPKSRPRVGCFSLGWPKADKIYNNKGIFLEDVAELKTKLALKYQYSILYAPSWENHRKQDTFVQCLKHLNVNLLIKQAPWSDNYPQVQRDIAEMRELHEGKYENVHFIDPNISIMECLSICDLIVSDESSVMFEGLLFNKPSLGVVDWLIPDCVPPRFPSIPYDFVEKTKLENLTEKVEYMIQNMTPIVKKISHECDRNFTHLGTSAALIVELIDTYINHKKLCVPPVLPTYDLEQTWN